MKHVVTFFNWYKEWVRMVLVVNDFCVRNSVTYKRVVIKCI